MEVEDTNIDASDPTERRSSVKFWQLVQKLNKLKNKKWKKWCIIRETYIEIIVLPLEVKYHKNHKFYKRL